VSARKIDGQLKEIKISAEKGGKTLLKLPSKNLTVEKKESTVVKNHPGFLEISFAEGDEIILRNK